ncbi:MAG: hypothetical protein ACU0BF_08055 [Paracoccaceae bacterium]
MRRPDRTRVVGALKLLLPLGALALLSVLFLLAGRPEPGSGLPVAGVEDVARDQAITGPVYSTVAEDGAVVTLRADRARPDGPGARLDAPRLRIVPPGGAEIVARAATARTDGDAARLSGGVEIATSGGIAVTTDTLSADLSTGGARAGAVAAQTPFGTLTAGRMEVRGDAGERRLAFTGGVHLLYVPPRLQGDPVPTEDDP